MLVWNDARVERSEQDEAEALQDLARVLEHLRFLSGCITHVTGERGSEPATDVSNPYSPKRWKFRKP